MPASPKQRKMAVVGSRSVGQSSVISTEHWHLLRAQTLTVLGKSSLTVQFVDGHFVDSYYPTIENTFSKVIKHRSQDFATEIVDTAGQVSPPLVQSQISRFPKRSVAAIDLSNFWRAAFQDEYSILNSKHFMGIHGYMLVYSVASRQSFEMIRILRDKILNHLASIPI